MKKINSIKYLIGILCIGCLLFSCSESDFEKYPNDKVTEGGFFTGDENVRQMLNDGYTSLRLYAQFAFRLSDLPSDDSYNSTFNNSLDHTSLNEGTWDSNNGAVLSYWQNCYTVISRAHMAMEKAEEVMQEGELKTRYIHEAKYLRALMYFNLVRAFGDVPLVLKDIKNPSELYEYGREPKANIYQQIIADLKDASNLPMKYKENTDIGLASGAAAKALLGEVYLTMQDYPAAKTVLGELVMANAGYGLQNKYADVFAASKSNNDEIVFAVQYARGYFPKMGNPVVECCFPNENADGFGVLVRGNGTYLITRDLYESFEAGDVRRDMIEYRHQSEYPSLQNQPVYCWTTKYYDPDMVGSVESGCEWIVHRWADVLLMYAEALNETGGSGEAVGYLEQVRARAGLTTDASQGGDKAAMTLAIENERRHELFCEGHRWFDLVRTGRALEVVNAHLAVITGPPEDPKDINTKMDNVEKGTNSHFEAFRLLFPIPFAQVAMNPEKIKQNPNY